MGVEQLFLNKSLSFSVVDVNNVTQRTLISPSPTAIFSKLLLEQDWNFVPTYSLTSSGIFFYFNFFLSQTCAGHMKVVRVSLSSYVYHSHCVWKCYFSKIT